MEDIEGIANLGMDVIHAFYNNPNRQKGTGVQVSISCASFIPKPFTPFQWEPEDSMESLKAKQKHLLESIPTKKLGFHITKLRPRFLKAFLPVVTDVSERLYFVRMSLAVNLILGTTNLILTLGCRLLKKMELTPIFTLTENVNFQNFYLGIILITV